ncbi:hypothetical protein EYZ11_008380 [Aspergillus tanneri]|uniref:Velvet complex subunit laeA n=1 Tax=Aspergillus tanneri TaxID=1220188 RepID=A0A4S3JB23_9EURO|nr:hypothetical protein EYZ11_008380 [Aspergillus tanneri]
MLYRDSHKAKSPDPIVENSLIKVMPQENLRTWIEMASQLSSLGQMKPAQSEPPERRPNIMSIREIIHPSSPPLKPGQSAFDASGDSSHHGSRPLSIEKAADYTENDRTYHEFHAGKYMLPNDEIEQDRLDFFHKALLEVTGKLIHVPLPPTGRFLDLGCGTGIWAIDLAKAYPEAVVVGVDLSPIQPSNSPQNCDFYAPFDFEFPWRMGSGFWDVIRLQMCSGSVTSWPELYNQVFAHLRPGAWLEQLEIDLEPRCENRTKDGSALQYWYQSLKWATEVTLRPIHHRCNTTLSQLQKAGFTDIRHKQITLPLNQWHLRCQKQHIGLWYGRVFFDSIEPLSLAPFTRILRWTPEEIHRLITDVKTEYWTFLAELKEQLFLLEG